MQITTYSSIKAWPEQRWLASMDITGKGNLLMSFFGPTEEAAMAKANSWWNKYSAGGVQPLAEGMVAAEMPLDGRMAFAGLIWMHNPVFGDRQRIEPSQEALYAGRGYVRGRGKNRE